MKLNYMLFLFGLIPIVSAEVDSKPLVRKRDGSAQDTDEDVVRTLYLFSFSSLLLLSLTLYYDHHSSLFLTGYFLSDCRYAFHVGLCVCI